MIAKKILGVLCVGGGFLIWALLVYLSISAFVMGHHWSSTLPGGTRLFFFLFIVLLLGAGGLIGIVKGVMLFKEKPSAPSVWNARELMNRRSRHRKLIIAFIVVFSIIVFFVYLDLSSPDMMTFGDQETKVKLLAITYHPGDNVGLRVICEDPIRVCVTNIDINSSVKGLENVTFCSASIDGLESVTFPREVDLPSDIVYIEGKRDVVEYKVNFVLPSDLQIENGKSKLYFTIKVEYFYAVKSSYRTFSWWSETKFINIALDAEMP